MSRYGHFKKYVCHYCSGFEVHDHEKLPKTKEEPTCEHGKMMSEHCQECQNEIFKQRGSGNPRKA